MWQNRYAKEPFDLKLFVLHGLKMMKWIVLSAIIGAVCIGGGYYLKKVTFGGHIPYVITDKLDVEYALNPETGLEYSYYVAYTWNDWIKSDVFFDETLEGFIPGMGQEDMIQFYIMTLPADVRNPYLEVRHPDKEVAMALEKAVMARLKTFAEEQKEIAAIEVIDSSEPELEVQDIRTFRAVVLGAVLGTFFALFALAFRLILGEGILVPEVFTYRYQIPVAGYIDLEGECSKELAESLKYIFRDAKKVGVTAVEPDLDLTVVKALLEEKEVVCLPSVLQVPESLEHLRNMEQNLLLVRAGSGNGKAVESVLYLCKMHDVKVDGVVLVDADALLIKRYRFKLFGNREDV